MKKPFLFFTVSFIILFSSCGAIRNISYGDPPVYFAYSDSIPIIKNQSEVATLVTRGNLSVVGHEQSAMRISNDKKNKQATVIDVLPGTYTLVKSIGGTTAYTRMEGNRSYVTTSSTPIAILQATETFEAGKTYWISAVNGKLIIDKEVPSNIHYYTDAAVDKGFPEYLKGEIAKSRNNAK